MEAETDGRFRSRVPADYPEALGYIHQFGLPVELEAAFVLGGWRKTATNEQELEKFMEAGQSLSPVGEVRLLWKIA